MQPRQRPLTLPTGSTIQPVDAYPLPQSAHSRGAAGGSNQRMTSPTANRKACQAGLPATTASTVAAADDIRGNVREVIVSPCAGLSIHSAARAAQTAICHSTMVGPVSLITVGGTTKVLPASSATIPLPSGCV